MTLDYMNCDYHKTHKSDVETDSDKWCMMTDSHWAMVIHCLLDLLD